jgi:hypothetical protein
MLSANGFFGRESCKIFAQRYFEKLPRLVKVIPCITGDIERGIFESFINSISKFRRVIIPGKGRNLISRVHVSDVANLIFTNNF